MDRRVKERLIGASILVALVVLVVPELLSGPKPDDGACANSSGGRAGTDSQRHGGSDHQQGAGGSGGRAGAAARRFGRPHAGADLPAAQTAPPSQAPAAPRCSRRVGATSTARSAQHPSAKPRPPPRPAPVESAASSPTSKGHGSWSVQLGSFASRANADNLTRQVKGQGFSVFVLSGGSGTSVRYRVRVGPLADRESAERMAAKLKSLGHVGKSGGPGGLISHFAIGFRTALARLR